jgi:hypothetical protein
MDTESGLATEEEMQQIIPGHDLEIEDYAQEMDKLWFKAHPNIQEHVRKRLLGEFGNCFPSSVTTHVKQIVPGCRVRVAVYLTRPILEETYVLAEAHNVIIDRDAFTMAKIVTAATIKAERM